MAIEEFKTYQCGDCGTTDPNNHGELCFNHQDIKDLINHPPHHRADTPYETIRVIEAWELDYHLGNVLKYIARHELKGDELGDLKKAQWYLNRRIALVEGQE